MAAQEGSDQPADRDAPMADPVGLRDAREIVARVEDDERAAEEARNHYRQDGLPTVEADPAIAARLRRDEQVVAFRHGVTVWRHDPDGAVETLGGRLYVTTSRLILIGQAALEVELTEIVELALAGEQVLVSLVDGTGLSFDATGPRLLRVQISSALAAARAV